MINQLLDTSIEALTKAIAGSSVLSTLTADDATQIANVEPACHAAKQNTRGITPSLPAHNALLNHAIAAIDAPALQPLAHALDQVKDQLTWRVDNGGYYALGQDVGNGYRVGNMHTLLIGQQNSPFYAPDFLFGLFMLAPRTLYRDHKHLAPELYLPLTGPAGWRFDNGVWQDHRANTLIYNRPNQVHATRVYDTPFLALFCWTQDIAEQCEVVPASDWDQIERDLSDKD